MTPLPPLPALPYDGPAELRARFERVRLFLCDVDGILTDGGVYMGQDPETKRFDIRDGFGLKLMQRQGIKVGWVSHRPSAATAMRAEELRIDFVHQARASKVGAIEGILAEAGVGWEDIAYLGDDLVDLGALRRAGLSVTVPDALVEVKAIVHYVTRAAAGRGAVREVAELILRAQDKWQSLVAEYSE
ncbi:MAG: HAD hydrolase family protein [Verrucomicrobiales bacterium]|nr:HAD hydrolase family protein [Verrucomicrobiales bacterium]MCP5528285.1 HAD hydrolase family protein [Verrucomicrobiales bacterium]